MMLHSIVLIRHGESADKQANQTDFDRILTVRGAESIHRLGMRLKEEKIFPDGIISSDAVRTVQTTRALSSILETPEPSIHFQHSLYNSPDEKYLDCISGIEKEFGLLMLVGHNPSISSVIGRITGEYSTALHPGQAAFIQLFRSDVELKPLAGKLIRLIGPFLK